MSGPTFEWRIGPGVYFFSLDAARWLAVAAARTLLNLPYYAADMTVERRRDGLGYESARRTREPAEFKAIYEPTSAPFVASAGSIQYSRSDTACTITIVGVTRTAWISTTRRGPCRSPAPRSQ